MGRRRALEARLQTTVTGMGYEFVGMQLQRGKRRSRVRVYIDHQNGIGVEDCAAVSHQVSGVLDVEDPVPGRYDLEVSSPGRDRPLFEAAHFERFSGERVRIRCSVPVDGRRNVGGVLRGFEDGCVLVDEETADGTTNFRIPHRDIGSARLDPQ